MVMSDVPSVVLLILSVNLVVLLVLAEVESMMDVKDTTLVVAMGVPIELDILLAVTWILSIQEYIIRIIMDILCQS